MDRATRRRHDVRRTRLGSRFALGFGRTAARIVLYPITLYFLIRRGPERRASRAYLQRITGRKASLWQVAQHIHCFAAVTLDRAFLLSERFKRFDIRTYGLDELRQAWAQQRGVLILGSHLGSFDALRVLARVPLGHQAARRHRRRAEPQAVAGAECAQPEAGAVDHQRAAGRHHDRARRSRKRSTRSRWSRCSRIARGPATRS